MKNPSVPVIVSLNLLSALLQPAFGNHRTGTLILPELIVAGDFNQDGKMDLAVNATGFDNVAILFGDGAGAAVGAAGGGADADDGGVSGAIGTSRPGHQTPERSGWPSAVRAT